MKIRRSFFNPFNFFLRLVDYGIIERRLHRLKSEKCRVVTECAEGVQFYHQAEVENMQNRKTAIRVGSNSHIRSQLLVFPYGGSIDIGSNCYLGEDSRIWSASSIKIGNGVLVSHNVNIIDTNSHEIDYKERVESYKSMLKNGHPQHKPNVKTNPIVIEDYVWINFNSVILKGVTIGKGAIIAAGTIVNTDVPPFCVFGGNPGKVIKFLEK